MRIFTAALLAVFAVDLAPAQGRSSANQRTGVIRGVNGEVLTRGGGFQEAVGGTFTRAAGPKGSITPLPNGVYKITIQNTGTGWAETFLVGIPKAPLVPAPVLTVFHGYGQTPEMMVDLTDYFSLGMARGWIVVAPTGAHKYNFGIDYAQTNVEKALEWVSNVLVVDPDRFYTVGFSMGGGISAGFPARHLDDNGLHFAGVVVHTGTTSVRDVYWQADDKDLLEHPLMFGGSPDQRSFRYQTASTIDLDTFTNTVDQASDMVRNLSHVPVYHFAALGDPGQYLVNETEKNHEQLALRGGNTVYLPSNDNVHQWWTLDETLVLDWLEPLTYQRPATGLLVRTLADRNARWFSIYVAQDEKDAFTPFRWTVVPAQNRMVFDEVANAAALSFDPDKMGLDSAAPIEIVFANVDATADDIVLEGYPQPPTSVTRNGIPTGAWTHDPSSKTITLHEVAAAAYPLWRVEP